MEFDSLNVDLSSTNIEIITQYYLGNTTLFESKDEDYKNLLLCYAQDKNSSSIRERVTLHYLGYEKYEKKHGADGYNPKTGDKIEVKPIFKNKGKLGGCGNFNDMTLDLLESKREFNVVCSYFYIDRLIYIVQFPFEIIYEKIKKPIVNAKIGKRVVCHFTYKSYDDESLIVHYYNDIIAKKYRCLPKNHMDMLIRRSK